MRAIATCMIALGLIASPAMAAGRAGDKNSSAANTSNDSTGNSAVNTAPAAAANTAAPAKTEASSMEIELDQLRGLVESQTKELQEAELKMAALEEKLNAGPAAAAAPAEPASPASPVAAISAPAVNAAPGKAQTDAPGPASISYKGITLTPGGFMAAETVWRQKALASDVNTPFNSVPFDGASQAHTSEFNASGRQSRISMLVQGSLPSVKIGGYYEMDFLSAGVTSNNNQSNSYTMRQRQFWGQAAFTNGLTITGGQMWSLLTETTAGMDNRTEALPMVIDAQYVPGFSWARQFGFRVTKNFNNKIWLGMSVEESQATLTVHGNATVASGGSVVCTNATCTTTTTINPTTSNNFLLGAFGTAGGLYNTLANYAFNPAPDLVFKAVFQPGFGHYEVFGVLSQFRDRAFPCVPITGTAAPAGCPSTTSPAGAFNSSETGGGIGANARWALMNKKIDAGIHFLGGDGIGRYGSTGLSDVTTRPNGTLALLRNYQALATLQFHPTPKLDVYMNVGGEYEGRAAYNKTVGGPASGNNEGYGVQSANNSGCWTETLPLSAPGSSNTGIPDGVGGGNGFIPGPLANCTGDTRNLIEGTIGFWYRFYNGPKGRIQWGAQYANYIRNTWHGAAGTAGNINQSGQPHADQNMIFTSFRYYLP